MSRPYASKPAAGPPSKLSLEQRAASLSPEELAVLQKRLLTEQERHQLLVEWNDTQTEYPQDKCVHELFEDQVQRTPDAIAVVFEDQELTYQELNQRANQLAHYLRSLGVGPERLVGLCLERSRELVIGILGILKAGGAYLPLDADDPLERLQFMLRDADVGVIVTQQRLLDRLPETNVRAVCLDTDAVNFQDLARSNSTVNVTADNLAYVMFTSGSTGRPKGVQIQHDSIARLVFGNDYTTFGPDRVFLQLATASFDASTFELWGALLHGAKLVVAPVGLPDFRQLDDLLKRNGVTTLFLTTTVLNQVVDYLPQALSSVDEILIGGEALSVRHICKAQAALGSQPQLMNVYGPTESTTFTTCYRIPSHVVPELESIPIGRPIANTQVYVLDNQRNPVPIGVAGELFIGGAGLARGYLNRPELTAERFVANPFSDAPNSRLYRTGDRCYWRLDGTLEFLGRLDDQVKLRGFRIELGEVESALNEYPDVTQSVVTLREDRPGDKRLVAYCVRKADHELDLSELRSHLRNRLPDYMVPAVFVGLDTLPLTSSGKVNRRALPAPDASRPELKSGYVAPRNAIEQQLVSIWCDVLGIGRVGIHDNFLALGGHSLLATRMNAAIASALQVDLPLRKVFESPTIAELSSEIQTLQAAGTSFPGLALERVDPKQLTRLPLSFAQQRLWFLEQMEGELTAYNMPFSWRLHGPLDREALQRALEEIVRRHEPLRTTFAMFGEEPIQVIRTMERLDLPLEDLSDLAMGRQAEQVAKRCGEEAERPFDLTRDLMLRASLLRLAEEEHVLLLTMHHIASDGWSLDVLWDELERLYGAYLNGAYCRGVDADLPVLAVKYTDYAVWQRNELQGQRLENLLQYWREQLDGVSVLELPTDRPRPSLPSYHGARHEFELKDELVTQLKALSQTESATLHMTLLAVFQTLLARYSGQDDITVGTPTAGRSRAELETQIGFFVNTLVLRTDFSEDPTFRELLGRVRQISLAAYDHQDLPFEKMVEAIQPERDLSRVPLVQVLFQLLNFSEHDLALSELEVSRLSSHSQRVRFDLEMYLWQQPENLRGELVYSSDLFDASTIERMVGHFVTLLEGIAADADQKLSELPLLTDLERHQLLVEWNDTQTKYPQDKCVHELFEDQVTRTPDSVAVVFEDQELTYHELNQRANQLAHYLRSLGVGPETLVGLCLERSPELVVGILGILKAGGAYLPLDADYPHQRLAFMLRDADVALIVTQQRLLDRLPAGHGQIVNLDTDAVNFQDLARSNPRVNARADNLAYVMYTSGSTGRPKGVQIQHDSIARLVFGNDYTMFRADRVFLQLATASFDASTFELWGALLHGAKLVVAPVGLPDLRQLEDLLKRNKVTTLWLTATFLNQVVEHYPQALSSVDEILTGGEALSVRHICRAQAALGSRLQLINGYGPTESTTFATCYQIPSGVAPELESIPIGRPIANTEVYVLDTQRNPVPIGVPGELYIGGAGLARGYLNRPELTAERFVVNPFSAAPDSRLYRTGDRCRWRSDGTLEFLGRLDDQVKLRGFRIELGEVEATLNEYADIAQSVVILREDRQGDKRLVAYCIRKTDHELDLSELRSHLRRRLPDYMVPATFVVLDTLPLTSSGKINRRALPAPDASRPELESGYVAPRNAIEQQLASIWGEVLGVERVGIHDNFFALGGHSLLAVRLFSLIEQTFSQKLPLAVVFQHGTISHLASFMADSDPTSDAASVLPLHAGGDGRPMFLMPGMAGELMGSIARALVKESGGSFPVMGIQPSLAAEHLEQFRDFQATAICYVNALQTYQPHGPYALAGYSFGGMMAYEVACLLTEMGEEVDLLAVIDTGPGGRGLEPMFQGRMAGLSRMVTNLPLWLREEARLFSARQFTGRVIRKLRQFYRFVISGGHAKVKLDDVFSADHLSSLNPEIMQAAFAAFQEYVPRPFSGKVTLFRAKVRPLLQGYSRDIGWNRFANTVEVRQIDGEHVSLLRSPHVGELIKQLSELLNDRV